jgi:hypothetical protein
MGGVVGLPMITAVHNAHEARINFGDLTPYLTFGPPIPPTPAQKNPPKRTLLNALSAVILQVFLLPALQLPITASPPLSLF